MYRKHSLLFFLTLLSFAVYSCGGDAAQEEEQADNNGIAFCQEQLTKKEKIKCENDDQQVVCQKEFHYREVQYKGFSNVVTTNKQ